MTDTFDRSQLDGKDRDQLSEIASALGVKSISRMRKADLVEAIVTATSGSVGANGSSSGGSDARPRKIRSTASGDDDLASLAAEEDALAAESVPHDEMALIRPRRSTISDGNGDSSAPSITTSTTTSMTSATGSTPTAPSPSGESSNLPSSSGERTLDHEDQPSNTGGGQQHQQVRDDDGQGNRRRRRRRGRERERPGGERQGGDRGEPRESREDFSGDLIPLEGLLDLRDEGYGFLRASGYLAGRNDAYVSASQVRRFGLRKGDHVKGATRPPASSEKYPALVRVVLINEIRIEAARHRVRFEDLTTLF